MIRALRLAMLESERRRRAPPRGPVLVNDEDLAAIRDGDEAVRARVLREAGIDPQHNVILIPQDTRE